MSKSVCIIGAGKGLGTEIALRFAEQGFVVCGIARDPNALTAFAATVGETGATVHTAIADVSDTRALRNALSGFQTEVGVLDVVVANTSMLILATPTEVSPDLFDLTWQVVTKSALVALQEVAPGMIKRGSGTFLLPGTPLALKPWPTGSALGAAKAAARNLMLNAHLELAPAHVQVAVITIDGMIENGTAFDPQLISKKFTEVAALPEADWQGEYLYQPAPS